VTGEAATATGETTGGAESAARARTTISEQSSITVAIPGFGHEHGRALSARGSSARLELHAAAFSRRHPA